MVRKQKLEAFWQTASRKRAGHAVPSIFVDFCFLPQFLGPKDILRKCHILDHRRCRISWCAAQGAHIGSWWKRITATAKNILSYPKRVLNSTNSSLGSRIVDFLHDTTHEKTQKGPRVLQLRCSISPKNARSLFCVFQCKAILGTLLSVASAID